MGVNELAEFLKVNKQTIYNWVNKKEIPFVKVGDLLRFDKAEIDHWLKTRTYRPDTVDYKGFEIQAMPYPLPHTREWTTYLYILKHSEIGSHSRNFSSDEVFPTREEAVKNCFEFGMKIIDGTVENCSVEDM